MRGYGNCHLELESFPTSPFSWNAVETHLWGKSQSACSIYKGVFHKRPSTGWPIKHTRLTQIPYPVACSNFNHIVPVSFCSHETMLRSLALYKLIHLFPMLRAFWLLKKLALRKNWVSGTVLMIQLTRNSPTCKQIDQNPLKWKLH